MDALHIRTTVLTGAAPLGATWRRPVRAHAQHVPLPSTRSPVWIAARAREPDHATLGTRVTVSATLRARALSCSMFARDRE